MVQKRQRTNKATSENHSQYLNQSQAAEDEESD